MGHHHHHARHQCVPSFLFLSQVQAICGTVLTRRTRGLTDDAKDPGDHGPNNWLHNCGGPDHTTVEGCTFAEDFGDMIKLVKTLGTTAGTPPKIYVAIPPPLHQKDSIGANQTVINSVYPKLVPLIAKANGITTTP